MNETEFEAFYKEHSRPLWSYICRIARSAEIADDIMQESFMRFLGAALPAKINEKAYLYRIATNLVYDYFRRSQREIKRQTNLDSNLLETAATYEPFASENGLTEVFEKLKIQERALLWLAYVEGYEHKEIAKTLNLKSLSVRVLLFRARRKLANLLDANNFEVEKL